MTPAVFWRKLRLRPPQRVGWVERSETHYRFAQPVPSSLLSPAMIVGATAREKLRRWFVIESASGSRWVSLSLNPSYAL